MCEALRPSAFFRENAAHMPTEVFLTVIFEIRPFFKTVFAFSEYNQKESGQTVIKKPTEHIFNRMPK